MLASWGARASEGTTFDAAPELAGKLLHDVVRIDAADIGEHGFGLVVGGDATSLLVVTARHVVARRPLPGLAGNETMSGQIDVGLCALPAAPWQRATLVVEFDVAAADDVALLRLARPPGYLVLARAVAPATAVGAGTPTWVLGYDRRCELMPSTGAIESARDARHNLRARHAGVRGGSSGAPLLIGEGIAALVKSSDQVTLTAASLAWLQERALAAGLPWGLVEARNIPPTDPRAAEIDLAETLNQYLFGLRDVHALLQQHVVARPTFAEQVARYNAGVGRFRVARDKYDGTLAKNWPADVAPAWARLREQLWAVHLNFWRVNPRAREIAESERTPADVRQQMATLEPEVSALESAIAQFLRALGQRRTDDEKPPA